MSLYSNSFYVLENMMNTAAADAIFPDISNKISGKIT
jgi:hypothetical protein